MASNNGYDLSITYADGVYKIGTLTLNGVVYTIRQDTYDSAESEAAIKGLLNGNLTSFRVPDGVTTLKKDRFREFTNLVSLDFNQVETIGLEECYGCTNLENVVLSQHTTRIEDSAFNNCTKIKNINVPHTITYVGQYAFSSVGSAYPTGQYTGEFIDDVGVETFIGDYAFYNSHLGKIKAIVTNIGANAFTQCNSLTEVEIVGDNAPVGSNIFSNCRNISKFSISGNFTSLGSGIFNSLAANTYTTAEIEPFDFSNSTFTTLGGDVWSYCYFDGTIYLPETLATINGDFMSNARGEWFVYFASVPSVTSSSYLRNNSSNFTIHYCFPYELLDQASSATNWSSHTSQMLGYGTGYAQGTLLPQYVRSSGVAISWFKDADLTESVAVSEGEDVVYYCTLGNVRLAWFVDEPTAIDGSVTISNGVATYSAGDPILVNTSVTITPAPTDQTKTILYMLTVNGQDYTSQGSATITMTQDLSITVIYWNGTDQPILPNLADNSWALIQIASKSGNIPSTWNIGDTKNVTIDGLTYQARLTDKTGKYTRVSDNSTAYLKFELTELLPTTQMYNSSSNNRPLQSPLLTDINSGTIYGQIESALTSVLEPVKVKVSQGGESSTEGTLVDFEGKFFFHREHDLFNTIKYSVQAEWDAISAQDEYYQTHNTDTDRIKHLKNGNNNSYWEMSPNAGRSHAVCYVNSAGYADNFRSAYSFGVCLCFAL